MGAPKRPAHTPRHRRPPEGGRKRIGKRLLIVVGALAMVATGLGVALAG